MFCPERHFFTFSQGLNSVSYTHLDVYKRQVRWISIRPFYVSENKLMIASHSDERTSVFIEVCSRNDDGTDLGVLRDFIHDIPVSYTHLSFFFPSLPSFIRQYRLSPSMCSGFGIPIISQTVGYKSTSVTGDFTSFGVISGW